MKRKFLKTSLLFCGLSVLVPVLALAQIEFPNPLIFDNFAELLEGIINFILNISLFGIGPIMIIVAGFYFVTAQGEPDKITKAKDIIKWVLIGLLIILCAKGIVTLFQEIIGVE